MDKKIISLLKNYISVISYLDSESACTIDRSIVVDRLNDVIIQLVKQLITNNEDNSETISAIEKTCNVGVNNIQLIEELLNESDMHDEHDIRRFKAPIDTLAEFLEKLSKKINNKKILSDVRKIKSLTLQTETKKVKDITHLLKK